MSAPDISTSGIRSKGSSRLAWRLFWREWHGGELSILFIALVVAVTATTTITLFTDRLHRTMVGESAELMGADLMVRSSAEIPQAWRDKAESLQIEQSQVIEFPSMVMAGETMKLASIRVVTDNYPLRGDLEVSLANGAAVHTTPPVGSVWVSAQLLLYLKDDHGEPLELGDEIDLGDSTLSVGGLIVREPVRTGGFSTFAPTIIVNAHDLAAAHVLIPGSRAYYYLQLAQGDRAGEAAIDRFHRWIESQLSNSQRLITGSSGRGQSAIALQRSQLFLNLASLIAVLLSGVAIALAIRRYVERHFDMAAVLRTLGASQERILQIFIQQLLLITFMGTLVGAVVGTLLQMFMFEILSGLIKEAIQPIHWLPLLWSSSSGVVVMVGFALPSLLRLRQVSALRVLRRDLTPMPVSSWLVYGISIISLVMLLWLLTGDLELTAVVVGGSGVVIVLLAGVTLLLFAALKRWLPLRSHVWKHGLQQLQRQPLLSIGQVVAFGTTLLAISLMLYIRTEFIANWQAQLPHNSPNHFAINIEPSDQAELKIALEAEGVDSVRLYPVIRGRLSHIKGVPSREVIEQLSIKKGERAHNSLGRDLNLTWSREQPKHNQLLEGEWSRLDMTDGVSIESEIAESLGLSLGDKVTFQIVDQSLEVVITSIRKVKWESFQPNFYFIFHPDVLKQFPMTYMTSFYLSPEQLAIKPELVNRFPSMTIVDVGELLTQISGIISRVTQAIELVLILIGVASLVVLFAALQLTQDERQHQGAILRTLGASRRQVRSLLLAEFGLLGLLAGIFALLGTAIITLLIYQLVLDMVPSLSSGLFLLLPLLGMGLIGSAGWIGSRQILRQSPIILLRQS